MFRVMSFYRHTTKPENYQLERQKETTSCDAVSFSKFPSHQCSAAQISIVNRAFDGVVVAGFAADYHPTESHHDESQRSGAEWFAAREVERIGNDAARFVLHTFGLLAGFALGEASESGFEARFERVEKSFHIVAAFKNGARAAR